MTPSEAAARYGTITNGVWANESQWMILQKIPSWAQAHWWNTSAGHLTDKIYCNKEFAPNLIAALGNLQSRGVLAELKTFDGCFNIRDRRGEPGLLSAHAYGIALDVNASENKLGDLPKLSVQFVQCWKDAGFRWGGDFKRVDGMHMTLGW